MSSRFGALIKNQELILKNFVCKGGVFARIFSGEIPPLHTTPLFQTRHFSAENCRAEINNAFYKS